jgi:Flp pilus assembly protein TadG
MPIPSMTAGIPTGTAMRKHADRRSGQALVEFALAWGTIILPLTFMIIYTSELLWIWHSVADFTRDGARYAATHCWKGDGSNVLNYMKANIPLMPDQIQFQNGPAQINVEYFSRDPDSGSLIPFSCSGDCSTTCIPDVVTVSVTNYQFSTFVTTLGIPPINIPDFHTSVPMESAGCDPEQGVCLP